VLRGALKHGLTSPLFAPAMRLGQLVRPLLPASLKAKVPQAHPAGVFPSRTHGRKMVLLEGCVQPAMAPNINSATARVLDALGIEVLRPAGAGCCGAIRYHLNDHPGALDDARRNIDAWWPLVEAGAEAIVMNASGCGQHVAEYGHLLARDAAYASRAQRISALTKDVAEILPALETELKQRLGNAGGSVVFHSPCTLQHGLKVKGAVEALLAALGATVAPVGESHFCCGSAGTYSVLQAELANELRDRRLGHLLKPQPEAILSANIGCITHLQSGTDTRVMHWIEWLDARLNARLSAR
jgi:glycolate oxidase iron-sulfur subunit